MTLLRWASDLAQRLGAVSLHLALRDGPRLADEPSTEAPVVDLVAQRVRRHPESECRLSEREHLRTKRSDDRGAEFVGALPDGLCAATPSAVRAGERYAFHRASRAGSVELGLLAVGAGVSHLVSSVVCASNLDGIAYVVNPLLSDVGA